MVRAPFRGVACPQSPTREELSSIRSGDDEAAALLLHRWEPVILASARRRTECPASRDEIAQAGRMAVLAAAEDFDASRGPSFNHYASCAVSNETLKAAQRLQAYRRHECQLDSSRELQSRHPFECRQCVRDWLCSLPRILQKVFVVLYRWRLPQRQAAARLGLSQPRISQLHRMLLERGRRDLVGLEAALMN